MIKKKKHYSWSYNVPSNNVIFNFIGERVYPDNEYNSPELYVKEHYVLLSVLLKAEIVLLSFHVITQLWIRSISLCSFCVTPWIDVGVWSSSAACISRSKKSFLRALAQSHAERNYGFWKMKQQTRMQDSPWQCSNSDFLISHHWNYPTPNFNSSAYLLRFWQPIAS